MEKLADHENLVDLYIAEDKKEAAVKLLFELICQYVDKKEFSKAESLKEKIYGVDQMALTELLRATEIIEDAKSANINKTHKEIWADLYRRLTKEEGNALYYGMQEAEYDRDEYVFRQEELNPKLFFINHGSLNLHCQHVNAECFLKQLNPGNVAGEDTFFSHSVCTVSLIATSKVKLSYLDRAVLKTWEQNFPALESKLQAYCNENTSEPVSQLLKEKCLDRRAQRRIKASGKVHFQLVDKQGKPSGNTLFGELLDISLGGMAFFIKAHNRDTASILLGRKLFVKIITPEGQTKRFGQVIAVRLRPDVLHHGIAYSLHFKFDHLLDKTNIRAFEQKS